MFKIGIIGCGGISNPHIEGILAIPDRVKITAVSDLSQEAMDKASQKAGGAECFMNYTDLIDRADVDAVDILLPHHLHKDAIEKAANAGKHILCEKPLCTSLAEADAITNAVESNRVTLMCAHNQVFSPCIREAKRRLAAGELGAIFQIRTCDCFALDPAFNFGWRGPLATAGGGELIDTGYHPSYMLLHLAGSRPVAVTAMLGKYVHRGIEGEDCANVLVRFENGSVGFIYTSWAWEWPEGHNQFHVIGEKGQMYGRGNKFCVKLLNQDPVETELPKHHEFHAEVDHFIKCLEMKTTPVQSHIEGIDVLKVILSAYEAAKTNTIVTL
ncbi:MAG: Gfo/Idh/MocA family oxidoreductase [bacterium]